MVVSFFWCAQCTSKLEVISVLRFMQSFNRANLKYHVKPKKPKSCTADVIALIKASFHGQSGIVYCLSRSTSVTFAVGRSHSV